MLSRRLPTKAPAPRPGSVSRAQFQTAMESYQSLRQPANRLEKSPRLSSDDYSHYENTSHPKGGGGGRLSSGGGGGGSGGGGVVLPSVHKPPVKAPFSPRRPVRRAGQRAQLPKVKSKGRGRGIAWYHEDGSVNLQALADLGQRRSFPRSLSYLERLHNIHTSKSWPQPSTQQLVLDDSKAVLPVQFLDDDQLTERTRAERQSFLATLLKADDLTEEDLDEIVHYFIPEDDPESPRTSPGVRKKKPVIQTRSRSAKGSLESPRARSVRFQQQSQPDPSVSNDASPPPPPPPRPHSSPAASSRRRHSDPFHVASPRSTDSSEEVAILSGFVSPPEVPASPRNIPEPKITYYDEDGEEIEEDIQTENEGALAGHENAGRVSKREASSPSPTRSSPRDAGTSPRPSSVESDLPPPEQIQEEMNQESKPIQTDPRSQSPYDASDDYPCPRGVSESSSSPRRSPPPRPETPTPRIGAASPPRSPAKTHEEFSTKENAAPIHSSTKTPPQRPGRASRSPGPSRTERTKSPKPTSANKHPQATPSRAKEPRPKSAKRSRTGSRTPPTLAGGAPTPKQDIQQNKTSRRHEKTEKTSPDPGKSPSHSSAAAAPHEDEEEPMSIPVISLTRGQLPSVPCQPLRIQATKTQSDGGCSDERTSQSETAGTQDSIRTKGSLKSSTLRGADSEMNDFERRVRRKDERMKIWLTTIAWNRHVECVSE